MSQTENTKPKIVIADYGTGNLNSVKRVLERMSVDLVISSSAADIAAADKIVLPGVGHFDTAMENLQRLDLVESLNDAVLERKKPVLGICLGMEVMAAASEEGERPGLGWIDAYNVRFRIEDPSLLQSSAYGMEHALDSPAEPATRWGPE